MSVTIATLANETLVIVARYATQTLRFGGADYHADADGGSVRVYGSGAVELVDGWWDNLTIVAGEYTGPAFTGDTASAAPIRCEWAGEPYESEARMIRDTIEPVGEWAFSDIIGWWGQTDDKRDVSERPQAHGADPDSVALRSSRAISFNAIWLGTSQADNENAVDDLSSIGAERAVIMRVETPAGASERVVKLVHQDAADHHARSIGQVAVDAIAVDPRRYAVTPSTASTGPATPGQGRVWPAVWPLVWPGGGSSGRITLTNTATAPSAPTFILRGGFESALITCVETGSRIGLDRLVPAGSSVVVDTAGARATIDGQSDVSRWLRYRGWELIPARGSLTFQFDVTGATGSPALDGSVRSAWW